jgi:cation diffusion facilitator CzcD-associated flavoprotein CzcO
MTDVYTFPWAPGPEYSIFCASGNEIWKYFKRNTEEYHLDENVGFDTKVLDSCWDESIKKWKIKIEQDKIVHDVEADVFINASGILK